MYTNNARKICMRIESIKMAEQQTTAIVDIKYQHRQHIHTRE